MSDPVLRRDGNRGHPAHSRGSVRTPLHGERDRGLRAIIFDCDGVLFDSWRANVAFYNAVLSELGQPPLDDAGERLAHTLSSPQLFEALFRDRPAVLDQARAIARDMDYSPFLRWMEPVSGLYEVLAELKQQYRLAMATNRGVTLAGVVRHFGLAPLLDLAVGISDVPRPKPFPDMIERCVQHFGIAPHEAVYVGDSLSDLEAARAAGTHFIGVGDLPGAALRVRHVGELRSVLNEWTSG